MITGKAQFERLLLALNDHLKAKESKPIELVVCGGAALNILGFLPRPTKDVDIVALAKHKKGGTTLVSATPLPHNLVEAAHKIATDFSLQKNWLNPGPTDLLKFGLPDGFGSRLTTISYGEKLTVHFAGRLDLIYLKLFAMVDQGKGSRHEDDLKALNPSKEELAGAALWCLKQDPSEGFRFILKQTLSYLGVGDVARKI